MRVLIMFCSVAVEAVVDLAAKVEVLVADVTACAKAILAIGANIEIDAAVKADIAVKVAAIIAVSLAPSIPSIFFSLTVLFQVIVKACLSVSVKFGIFVVLALLAKIDICLQLLLINLGICIDGIVVLVAKM
jgi:hypothetical protein